MFEIVVFFHAFFALHFTIVSNAFLFFNFLVQLNSLELMTWSKCTTAANGDARIFARRAMPNAHYRAKKRNKKVAATNTSWTFTQPMHWKKRCYTDGWSWPSITVTPTISAHTGMHLFISAWSFAHQTGPEVQKVKLHTGFRVRGNNDKNEIKMVNVTLSIHHPPYAVHANYIVRMPAAHTICQYLMYVLANVAAKHKS